MNISNKPNELKGYCISPNVGLENKCKKIKACILDCYVIVLK